MSRHLFQTGRAPVSPSVGRAKRARSRGPLDRASPEPVAELGGTGFRPGRSALRRIAAALLCASIVGCAAVPGIPGRELPSARAASPSAYFSGPVLGVSRRQVLEARDFTYAVAISRPPAAFAWSHLGARQYLLTVSELDPAPRKLGESGINPIEFDVEGLAFSPDGERIATASREGTIRLYSRRAELLRSLSLDEPLVSIAFSPDGKTLAAGGAKGTLTLLDAATLSWLGDSRAHRDEIRALAFADTGRLFSGGWDKSIAQFGVKRSSQVIRNARARLIKEKGLSLIPFELDRKPLKLALDARSPVNAVTGKFAMALGIDPAGLTDSTQALTANGPALVRIAKGRQLALKALRAEIAVAICDACVPQGADGVLGQDFLTRFEIAFDQTLGEAVVTLRPEQPDPAATEVATLEQQARFELAQFVNDLSIDRAGNRLGVALGATKAERNVEVYQREKKGIVEPLSPDNLVAVIDASNGAFLERHQIHHGVVSTVGISPDGRALASGGWDKRLYVFSEGGEQPLYEDEFGWSVRRVRFSPDGRYLAVGSWTPQHASNTESDPAAVVYDVRYGADAQVTSP